EEDPFFLHLMAIYSGSEIIRSLSEEGLAERGRSRLASSPFFTDGFADTWPLTALARFVSLWLT
ncbi:hypothetical protein A2U01_0051056, partial [Trifolium medium]|nr:hypothetical protein [Trifolium medium]